jgi:hypothetical protein
MRSLNAGTLEVDEYAEGKIPPSATLSHIRADDVVSLQDLYGNFHEDSSGLTKIRLTCEQATKDGFEYVWCDTRRSSTSRLVGPQKFHQLLCQLGVCKYWDLGLGLQIFLKGADTEKTTDAHAACALYIARNETNSHFISRRIEQRVEELLHLPLPTTLAEPSTQTQALVTFKKCSNKKHSCLHRTGAWNLFFPWAS